MTVTRVNFVCSGNICRSPMAEGIFKHQAEEAGLAERFRVESAGIGPWHVGEAPDARAQATARRHGVKLEGRAQQFKARDFGRFDRIIALDSDVAEALRRMAPSGAERDKVSLLRAYDPARMDARPGPGRRGEDLDVPDPYYGGTEGFEEAYEIIERSSRRLLDELREAG